ncbi:MAG: hypothetical protein GKR89_00190 [Candidatus Latescibacteria bacterium]|nr:hypothetical protein [Candidatus Latescibacterota bacterium]
MGASGSPRCFHLVLGERYGSLELYLMGLLPAQEIEPHIVMQDFEFVEFDEDRQRYVVTGQLDMVTVEDIIEREGPRLPAWEAAQKSFRLVTVVVSAAPLTRVALTYFDRQSAFIGSDAGHDFAFAAATGYRATLDTRLGPSTATAVLAQTQEAVPQDLQLAQNFPNPFNSNTVIPFALPVRAEVELTLYNAAGQQVAVLADGVREAGAYAVSWDGRMVAEIWPAESIYTACRRDNRWKRGNCYWCAEPLPQATARLLLAGLVSRRPDRRVNQRCSGRVKESTFNWVISTIVRKFIG